MGMPQSAVELVERLQPYHRPDLQHPTEHPLVVLYGLECEDKHRALLLTAQALYVQFVKGLPDDVHLPPITGFRPAPHEKGT
jgi:hypothetical protein